MSKLCSASFKKLFDGIKKMTFSMDEFIEMVNNAMPSIANELSIGHCAEIFTAPPTYLNINGINQTVVFYDNPDSYSKDDPETFTFRTGEGGSLVVKFYHYREHCWDEEELSDLAFLAELLFILGGRVQLLGTLQKTSVTDMSSGASNIKGFTEHCAKLAAQNLLKDHVMIFFNLKNFKFINRIAGERQGDVIIRKYAHTLMNFMRGTEKLARPGGDNFIAIVARERSEEFLKLLAGIALDIDLAGEKQTVNVTARAGIYKILENDTPDIAINASSIALNTSKKSGRCDVVWFIPDMLDKTIKANEVSNLFPEALANKEFVIYYQPKVTLADNALCGCEALTRWIRDGKVVSPADFIPVLEREGTICRLDFYVLENVCSDIRRWLDMGLTPVRVSTNFSKLHLHNTGFADEIISVINKYGIDPSYIEVELTESTGYEDYEALAEFVRKMKSCGICTSIDDFGTGYSSLNLLKDLDVDIIKLDKSFLDNLGDEKKTDEVVIRNIVTMVNELDMQVVAEGVETRIQAELLGNFSCSMAQGYLFDKPLPCSDFEKRLKNTAFYTGK